MAQVKFSRVISVSSEDPRYLGNNLLKSNVSNCWKCKDAGEKQAIIILQLERLCHIQRIHIGNENSAFIEILVGKSAIPDSYEVLRVASLLMSVQDVKHDKNKNIVRFFEYEEFAKSIADQSWDRVKIVCSQPFNKHTQYGLSFIKVYAKSEPSDENKNSISMLDKFNFKKDRTDEEKSDRMLLGKFALKKNDSDEDHFSAGSFFARRIDISDPLSTAAAIRTASHDTTNMIKNQISSSSKRLSDALQDFKGTKRKRKTDYVPDTSTNDYRRSITGSLLYGDSQSDEETNTNEPSKDKKNSKIIKTSKNNSRKIGGKVNEASTTASSQNKSPKMSKQKISPGNQLNKNNERKQKPFSRLLEGVTFVISGYTNPYRGELRSKALKMGAKYKADWDSSCTHLICAFSNTPKLNQVKGRGWIVRKDWIEDCYSLRKRLLSSSYKLDPNDTFSKTDDEEIWEEMPRPENSNFTSTNISNKFDRIELNNSYSSGDIETTDLSQETTSNPQNYIYDADTDVDSDYSNSTTQFLNETITLKILPDFFETKKFYLGTDLPSSTTDMLTRYIIAYKGNIVDDVDDVHYILSADKKYNENITGTPVVLPDWIWECNDQKMLIPVDSYLV